MYMYGFMIKDGIIQGIQFLHASDTAFIPYPASPGLLLSIFLQPKPGIVCNGEPAYTSVRRKRSHFFVTKYTGLNFLHLCWIIFIILSNYYNLMSPSLMISSPPLE